MFRQICCVRENFCRNHTRVAFSIRVCPQRCIYHLSERRGYYKKVRQAANDQLIQNFEGRNNRINPSEYIEDKYVPPYSEVAKPKIGLPILEGCHKETVLNFRKALVKSSNNWDAKCLTERNADTWNFLANVINKSVNKHKVGHRDRKSEPSVTKNIPMLTAVKPIPDIDMNSYANSNGIIEKLPNDIDNQQDDEYCEF